MRDLFHLTMHLLGTVATRLRPSGMRSVASGSRLLEQQIIIGNRARCRAPDLSSVDRFVFGLLTLFIRPRRIPELSAIVKSSTLFKRHKAVADRKYGRSFSPMGHRRKPGPKGPSPEFFAARVYSRLR